MNLSQINWFYEEPEKTSKRLFDTFSQGKPQISSKSLKTHLNNLKFNPSMQEINDILTEVMEINFGYQEINYELFRNIRISPPTKPNYKLALNVFAEYTKYNCAYIHRGFVTEDAIETALGRENNEHLIDMVTKNMTALCFNSQYKLIGIKELYCFMKQIIPNQWRQWICDQLLKGFEVQLIAEELAEKGFNEVDTIHIVQIIKEKGYQSALPDFLDKTTLNVVHCAV
ncbi:Conserved_hypothetical protein [Hexamita inflata]|uniref:Uncharacterized protein n=1 Tax=Hexamita inflata TaxID=28002 RepID=A0AA86UWX8_9EUKA|nr:Conserved hypothetical protein [Hexamita inflata]CAI9937733.1 Conserved hypothetical protein [Hexamita inflata]CAI9975250.1 Conserved hypothetical protein [Hexamita inflata]